VPQRRPKPLPAIWRVPDDLWAVVERVLAELDPPKQTGRRWIDPRGALDAIIFRLRSGCQWDQLPERFGPKSTVHDWFQRWVEGGILEKIWAVLVAECDELGGVQWQWQAADAMLGKARFGGEKDGQEPHRPREKGHQEEPPDRRRWRASGCRDGRRERGGTEAVEGDDRGDRGRAARPG
jgi:transposase